jgi:hypothetical protein
MKFLLLILAVALGLWWYLSTRSSATATPLGGTAATSTGGAP